MNPKIIKTSDGSHSLYLEDLDESYHSVHGAMNESNHVFIKNGLSHVAQNKTDISIFEMGFGTGLNALVTRDYALHNKLKIRYTSIEKHPLELDLCQSLNYYKIIKSSNLKSFYESLHLGEWGSFAEIDERFFLLKIKGDIEFVNLNEKYDLIYFDAFGPRVQLDMWTVEIFQKLYNALNSNGVFVTYCAKGQVRRDLERVGFKMERLPGPPRKREMLRGIKVVKK